MLHACCLRRRPGARWAIAIVVVHNYRSYAFPAVPYLSASHATAAKMLCEDEVLSRLARTCERIGASIDHFFHSPRLETCRNAHPRDGCIVGTLCLPR